MLRSVIEASLKSRLVVLGLAAGLMVIGIARLPRMPVDALPEFSPPYVEIQTESLGLSAEEVEQLITVPMEQDLLNGLPWLDTIRSESVPGLSSIVLVFQPGTDLMRARQMVSERMTQAVALPHVSKPPTMLQPFSATSRVLIVGLSSKTLSPIQMSVLARWTIAPRLMGVPGVANVAIWGQRDRQLQVQVDPTRMKEQGVSLLKVLETTGNALWVSSLSFVEASTPGTGGFIDTDNQRLGIRHILPIVSSTGLAQVPIEGTTRRLGDVADVVEDHQPLIGDALTKNGSGLLLVIGKFPGANTLEVTRGVEEAMAELGPGLPGMEVDTNIFRPAEFIEAAGRNVARFAMAGLLLIALALLIFFAAWRPALVSLVSIVVSLTAAALVLYLTGATMNMIALTGFMIAIGVVVCHAIIVVEKVVSRLRQERAAGVPTAARSILATMLDASGGTVCATLIVLLAVSPILFIEASSGAFFRPMAVSYALAVLASLVASLTVIPALSLLLLRSGGPPERPRPLVAWLERRYQPVLAWTSRHGRLALAGLAVFLLLGLVILPKLNRSLLPAFKERQVLIDLSCVPGTSQPEMSRIAGRVCDELRSVHGVRDVGAHIGRAVRGDQVVNVNSATLWVSMDATADYDRTARAIENVVDGYPGIRHGVTTYLREKSSDIVAEPEDNVVVRVYGDAAPVLRGQAERVRQEMAGIRGLTDLHVKLPERQAALETEVNLEAAQRYGLKPGDVRRAAATLLSGIQVGSLFEEQKVFDVVVWSTPATRHSLSSIHDLLIDTPSGGQVRLGDVARIRIVPTESVIRHEAVKRYLDVVASVEGRDPAAAATEIEQRLRAMPFALESHAHVLGGGREAPQLVHSRVLIFGLAAIIGMFFLLQAAFGSWSLALLALVSTMAALVGGLGIAAVTGNILSLGALAGLLSVFGVTTCNTVGLIRRYQRLERREGESFGPALMMRGAREQLAPMLLTTVAAGLAMIPALLLGDLPGLEIARPMAIVTLCGLASGAIVNLFFVPAVFLSLGISSLRETDPFAVPEESGAVLGALPVPAVAAE